MGKIVVLEGTDFSGKTTQYEKLIARFSTENITVGSDSFPNYDSESSYLVKEYLAGHFGDNADDIDPKTASLFYTLDRCASYNSKPWGAIYRNGGNILFSRYITSNILHQASKYDTLQEKLDFISWLYNIETELLGIPKEDCTIFLDMPPFMVAELKKKRLLEQGGLSSSGEVKDIHENNTSHLLAAYTTAKELAHILNWTVVSCVDDAGVLKSIETIHTEIYEICKNIFNF